MPRLTVKSVGEMLIAPNIRRAALKKQKYPKKDPYTFQIPYYRTALSGIRAYFLSGGKPRAMDDARTKSLSLKPDAKRIHNIRLLDSFLNSDLAKRQISIVTNSRISIDLQDVTIKLSPDFHCKESGSDLYLFLHTRAEKLSPAMARATIEVCAWLLEQEGYNVPISSLEYFDLFSNISFTYTTIHSSTIDGFNNLINEIPDIWDSISE